MKKRYLAILTIILALAAVLASCSMDNNAPESEGLSNVRFTAASSRALSANSYSSISYSDLYWFYTAVKDNDGLGTLGQKTEETKIGAPDQTGFNASVGQFSVGKWIFNLYAYDGPDRNTAKLIFSSGDISYQLKNQIESVPITVSSSVGRIEFNNATFAWKSGSSYSGAPRLSFTLNGTDSHRQYTAVHASIA